MNREFKTACNRIGSVALVFLTLSLPPIDFTSKAQADDRDLFRNTASEAPYLFILFDLSGSMNSNLRGRGTPLHGDDSDSRLFQAKEGLYEVLEASEGVNFGFATFPNHFRLRVNDIVRVRSLGRRITSYESNPKRCP